MVHINIVGSPTSSHGYRYITCIDWFTRWPEAFPLVDITAESVARSLTFGRIARFGVPSTVVADHGRQVRIKPVDSAEPSLWYQITAYHPAANGLVECLYCQTKAALKCYTNPSLWIDGLQLLLILLGIKAALKEDLHCTPAEMVYIRHNCRSI